MERLDGILLELIARRRTEQPRGDIVGILLAASDEGGSPLGDRHIRDELVTLLLAGHETTATALAWALERVAHDPALLDEVRTSLDDGEDGLIQAVAVETLRVRPVVLDVARKLSTPVDVCGYHLPAGSTVVSAIYLVHLDPRNHIEPEEFRPDRFAGKRPSQKIWLPFGGGRRRCLGAGLAEMELTTILSVVLSEFVPEPGSRRAESARLRGITFAPSRGARLRMHRRPLGRETVR